MVKQKYTSTNKLESLLAADVVCRCNCEIERSRVRPQSLHPHVITRASCSYTVFHSPNSIVWCQGPASACIEYTKYKIFIEMQRLRLK